MHRADVGPVGAVGQRLLVHDRGAVDEPLDHGDVRPRRSRVVEAVVVLGLPGAEVTQHVLAGLAEILGHSVEHLAVSDFVLDLGRQGELATQAWGAGDPLAFRQRADDLAVGVVLGHAEHADAVCLRHPIARLDEHTIGDVRLELGEFVLILLRGIDGHDWIGGAAHG